MMHILIANIDRLFKTFTVICDQILITHNTAGFFLIHGC